LFFIFLSFLAIKNAESSGQRWLSSTLYIVDTKKKFLICSKIFFAAGLEYNLI
jgi:hypothetical protein